MQVGAAFAVVCLPNWCCLCQARLDRVTWQQSRVMEGRRGVFSPTMQYETGAVTFVIMQCKAASPCLVVMVQCTRVVNATCCFPADLLFSLQMLQEQLAGRGASVTTVLLSEVSPAKLAAIGHVEAWVQIACPRLSIDWGEGFSKPTLTPYEAMVALGMVPGWWEDCQGQEQQQQQQEGVSAGGRGRAATAAPYPMDYYAKDGGVWNSSYHRGVRA
jgi:hypothetical protein